MGMKWYCVSNFIFLAFAYQGWWPVLSIAVSTSYLQRAVSVLIIAELARRGSDGAEISNQISAQAKDLNPEPHDWQSSTQTTRPLRTPLVKLN